MADFGMKYQGILTKWPNFDPSLRNVLSQNVIYIYIYIYNIPHQAHIKEKMYKQI